MNPDIDSAVTEIRKYIHNTAFFVEDYQFLQYFDSNLYREVLEMNLICINIQSSESDLIRFLRFVRSKVPATYAVRLGLKTVL